MDRTRRATKPRALTLLPTRSATPLGRSALTHASAVLAQLSTIQLLTILLLTALLLTIAPGSVLGAPGVEDASDLFAPERVQPISTADFERVLEHYRGKVVIVNLWATWCIPCIQELPELAELQKRYRDRGLQVLAVSLDDLEDLEDQVRPFFAERAPGLISYLAEDSDSFAFVEPLDPEWIGALPTSFFIDRQGEIRKSVTGRLTFRSFEREVLTLLEEPATSGR